MSATITLESQLRTQRRTRRFLAAGALVAFAAGATAFVVAEVDFGDTDTAPAGVTRVVDVNDDPLIMRYGDQSNAANIDVNDDPLMMRYGRNTAVERDDLTLYAGRR
jgi:hypothetical protein